MPPPPPKPREVIIEKWVREDKGKKTKKVVQKQPVYQPCYYNYPTASYQYINQYQCQPDMQRSYSNELVYAQTSQIYSPASSMQPSVYSPQQMPDMYNANQPKKGKKIAGYRIIRQIIPGANSSQADIERALAQSSYSTQSRIYSPLLNTQNMPPFYPTGQSAQPIYPGYSQVYQMAPNPPQIPRVYSPNPSNRNPIRRSTSLDNL